MFAPFRLAALPKSALQRSAKVKLAPLKFEKHSQAPQGLSLSY